MPSDALLHWERTNINTNLTVRIETFLKNRIYLPVSMCIPAIRLEYLAPAARHMWLRKRSHDR